MFKKIEVDLASPVVFSKTLSPATKAKYEKLLLELCEPLTTLEFLSNKEKIMADVEAKDKPKPYYVAIVAVLPKGELKDFYKEKAEALKVVKKVEEVIPYTLPTNELLTEREYKDMLEYVQSELAKIGPYDFKNMVTQKSTSKNTNSINYYWCGKFYIYLGEGSLEIPASEELKKILDVYIPYRKNETWLLQDGKGKPLK